MDDCCEFDGEGSIVCDVNGQWFAIDDSFLDVKVSFSSETATTYVAKVLHNGVPSYMTFTVNHDTDAITIDKLVKIPDADGYEYDAALRVDTELNYGDKIVPILRTQDANSGSMIEIEGKKIKYKSNTKIKLKNLPDGEYLQAVTITDLRGDEYSSPVADAQIKGGKVTDLKINPEFVDVSHL